MKKIKKEIKEMDLRIGVSSAQLFHVDVHAHIPTHGHSHTHVAGTVNHSLRHILYIYVHVHIYVQSRVHTHARTHVAGTVNHSLLHIKLANTGEKKLIRADDDDDDDD